jgi:hypothetical protein
MAWITETTWPLFLLASVLAIVCIVRWHRTRSLKYLGAVILLAGLCGVAFFLERSVITDRERIEQHVLDMTDAFRREDFDRCWSYFSPSASSSSLEEDLRAGMSTVDVEDDLRITDLSVKLMANGTRATSHFRANATISFRQSIDGHRFVSNLGRMPSRWELTWRREKDDWKIVRVTRLNPTNGTEMPILSRRAT